MAGGAAVTPAAVSGVGAGGSLPLLLLLLPGSHESNLAGEAALL